ncbi:MAG: hypothetical protein SOV71_06075 [Anaerovoracaceae bacterium]|nr:hypothetical protein [Bacillota bacterium]MDY2671105.1 hypothetical protein [Anaerovoracaceae bacterium]
MKILDDLLESDIEYLREKLSKDPSPDNYRFNKLRTFNYNGGSVVEGSYTDPLLVSYYMLKYATFYSLEYYIIYDLLLRIFKKINNDAIPNVISFGSGSMIDGLSLDYAFNRIFTEDDNRIYKYFGTDLYKWPRWGDLKLWKTDISNKHGGHGIFKAAFRVSMDDFWRESELYDAEVYNTNIIFFPKMLSENIDNKGVDGRTVIDRTCEEIKDNARRFESKYIFICASYRGYSTHDYDKKLLEKIIAAFGKYYEWNHQFNEQMFEMVKSEWIGNEFFDNNNGTFSSVKDIDKADYYLGGRFHDFQMSKQLRDFLYVSDAEIRTYCEKRSYTRCEFCRQCHFKPRLKLQYNANAYSEGDKTCFSIIVLRKKGESR